jgi:hypothetical protein
MKRFGSIHSMPRKLRVQYPDAICHVMNRGDCREPIFKDDKDRQCAGTCSAGATRR